MHNKPTYIRYKCAFVSGMILIFTRYSRFTHSSGNFNKRIGRSLWKRDSRGGRLERLHLGSHSFILGSICGRVRQVTYQNLMYSMKQYWVGNISRKDCFRISILLINNWGFLLGLWWCVWFWIEEKWCISWLVSSKCWLMSVSGHFRKETLKNRSWWFKK